MSAPNKPIRIIRALVQTEHAFWRAFTDKPPAKRAIENKIEKMGKEHTSRKRHNRSTHTQDRVPSLLLSTNVPNIWYLCLSVYPSR